VFLYYGHTSFTPRRPQPSDSLLQCLMTMIRSVHKTRNFSEAIKDKLHTCWVRFFHLKHFPNSTMLGTCCSENNKFFTIKSNTILLVFPLSGSAFITLSFSFPAVKGRCKMQSTPQIFVFRTIRCSNFVCVYDNLYIKQDTKNIHMIS
jgi:hypothetical protein